MIKRTPQEIADFFGCEVSLDYVEGKMLLKDSEKAKKDNIGCIGFLTMDLLLPFKSPTSKHTYEPCVRNTCEKRMENARITHEPRTNPEHIEEVYTHKEYVVAEAKRAQDLAKKVNVMLDHGWKPQGGIAIEYLPESDGYAEGSEIFYQAMVRGV